MIPNSTSSRRVAQVNVTFPTGDYGLFTVFCNAKEDQDPQVVRWNINEFSAASPLLTHRQATLDGNFRTLVVPKSREDAQADLEAAITKDAKPGVVFKFAWK